MCVCMCVFLSHLFQFYLNFSVNACVYILYFYTHMYAHIITIRSQSLSLPVSALLSHPHFLSINTPPSFTAHSLSIKISILPLSYLFHVLCPLAVVISLY